MNSERIDKRVNKIGASVLAVLGVISMYGMLGIFPVVDSPSVDCAHNQMILCAELPPSASYLTQVLTRPENVGQWTGQLIFDFPFIVAFTGLMFIAARLFIKKKPWQRVAIAAALLGALCDVVEDTLLLVAADNPATISESLATAIRTAAQTKFSLLAVSITTSAAFGIKANKWAHYPLASALACATIGLITHLSIPQGTSAISLSIAIVCITTLIHSHTPR